MEQTYFIYQLFRDKHKIPLIVMDYILVNSKYNILELIGEGTFGRVYKAENIRTKELVAIKVEPIKKELKMLKNEANIYHYLMNSNGIPTLKWYGSDDYNYYLVLNYLGKSLEFYKQHAKTISLKTIYKIAIQCVQIIQTIHDKGLIHRDIKPENFLFGQNEGNTKQLYLIDYGFCKPFIDYKTNQHIHIKNTTDVIGTYTFMSDNAKNKIELSRRDDIISCFKMIEYLGNICLEEDIQIYGNIAFDEKPDYEKIIAMFRNKILNM